MRGTNQSKEIEYDVDVSLPQYFTLPSTVKIPMEEDISVPWESPMGIYYYYHLLLYCTYVYLPLISSYLSSLDCGCVDIPLRFQAGSVGKFICQVVLRSWCDTRVFILEAVVTPQVHITL